MKPSSIILALALSLAAAGPSFAQSEISPLAIGDTCPDFEITGIINYPQTTVRLSDFNGKLVILDFWATWCGPCVKALPKLDSLQKMFPDQLVILPVTRERAQTVATFTKQHALVRPLSLPYVTRDTLLNLYFPHRGIPHEVWIDGSGKVVAITDDKAVEAEAIRQVLKGNKPQLKTKSDILERDFSKPLLAGYFGSGYQLDPKLICYQSLLAGKIEGSSSTQAPFRVEDGLVKWTFTNWPIAALYKTAFMREHRLIGYEYTGDYSELLASRVYLEVRDSAIFYWSGKNLDERWKKDATRFPVFSYQQYIPAKDSMYAREYMAEDLNRYFGSMFGIEGLIAKRKVKCWALLRIPQTKPLLSSGDQPEEKWDVVNYSLVLWKGKPFRVWLKQMLMFPLVNTPIPIINETGYSEELVTMELRADLKDPVSLNQALAPYGLEFRLVERELDMIVIRNKKN